MLSNLEIINEKILRTPQIGRGHKFSCQRIFFKCNYFQIAQHVVLYLLII